MNKIKLLLSLSVWLVVVVPFALLAVPFIVLQEKAMYEDSGYDGLLDFFKFPKELFKRMSDI